jgi:hypothetical protein
MKLKMLSTDDTVAEIKRIYYQTSRETIARDLARAVDLLKTLPTEDERERAAVYMDGLSEMRSDWARQAKRKPARKGPAGGARTKKR